MQVMTGYDWTKNQGLDKIKVNNKLVAFFSPFLIIIAVAVIVIDSNWFSKGICWAEKEKKLNVKSYSQSGFSGPRA